MNYLIILFFIFYITETAIARVPKKLNKCTNGNAQKLWDKVVEKSERGNVDSLVNYFRKIVNNGGCRLKNKNKREFFEIIDEVKKTGRESELKRLVDQIENIAEFRSPQPELYRIIDLTQELGLDIEDILDKDDTRELLVKGKAASNNRKKSCTYKNNVRPPIETVRHQDSVGWCFAFSSADLLSYKYNKKISAVDIAITFNENNITKKVESLFENSASNIEGGFAFTALEHAIKKGVCFEKDLPSEGYTDSNLLKLIQDLETMSKNYLEYINYSYVPADHGILSTPGYFYYNKKKSKKTSREIYKNYFSCNATSKRYQEAFPNITFQQFMNVLHNSTTKKIYKEMSAVSCKRKRPTKPPEVKWELEIGGGGKDLINIFDKQLNNDNIVEMLYFSSTLFEPNYKLNGRHSSIIVGRRFNEKTEDCEYLVRNSYGPNCAPYDKMYKKYNRCNKGMIWVPESLISESAYEATWLE